ncbi:MAG: aminotransferase class V-fold PLP-dependent enzyme [Alphaproteobacteria bacterium]|jgi:alanine-glyoxylate transaminase / serine-glyoxylate transaminase / serine-pyruvate transaminase|nr:aminotransferase class V-fold PLP-dependent enzyme [Rhodospirillaceae bacterium]MDG2479928.1 aminotransferase class V-fold PLP-dependent enzyme [Alphaproteobacteria bacterium]MBT6202822.1 aminotransferase class V-fold PLP-dependent enzyme [Rhodospirillaceae bacterium]MBT6512843.1 aminotransferase class V-fold PLP-dependent enzyme [Rhodospirillaceae bacterium]MBT7615585.1 aminotransferase class V-fold PLP-dependent enzyme [Rhodospirillaceae bacterium]
MTVRQGREFLSIPGPTTVPDRVLSAMHHPAVDIYAGELLETTMTCLGDLKKIFRTQGETYIYAANGHGAWEASLTNCLSRGDKVLVLESGLFAVVWGEMAGVLGLDAEILPSRPRRAVDPEALEARLRADSHGEIKAVLTVQIDTASGVVNDIPALRRAIDHAGHDALLMVDTIASLACMPFEMDAWGVDVAIAGSQKGLMVPPGLSFVAANDKARQRHQSAALITRYWDWTMREGPEHYMKYCGTAPEHMLFGLRESLDMLLEEGLDNATHRHALLAGATRAAVACWGQGGTMEFNILEDAERSNSVTTVRINGADPARLLEFCKDHCGVILGIGIGPELTGKAIRIAHMGHVNAPMILGTLGVLETALVALDIDHGRGGIEAATASLGAALAQQNRETA